MEAQCQLCPMVTYYGCYSNFESGLLLLFQQLSSSEALMIVCWGTEGRRDFKGPSVSQTRWRSEPEAFPALWVVRCVDEAEALALLINVPKAVGSVQKPLVVKGHSSCPIRSAVGSLKAHGVQKALLLN